MASPSKLAADLLATTDPDPDEDGHHSSLELVLEVEIFRGDGKGKLAGQLSRLMNALRQVSTGASPSAASKAALADYDETLQAYIAASRRDAEDWRQQALIPLSSEEVKERWEGLEASGENKGTDVKRQMERIEADTISGRLACAMECDNAAKFIESLRPRFAELSQSLGLGEQRNRGAAR